MRASLPQVMEQNKNQDSGAIVRIMLSVVIPALNAVAALPACLAALAPGRGAGLVGEILVVDGGSADGTMLCAQVFGARVMSAPPGRGVQLAAGAEATRGDWLLFLHADTCLEPGWETAAANFIADPANAERAAAFRFALDDRGASARRLERWVDWRCRVLGLAYGDQGLLLSRAFYRRLGGYPLWPLMEDVHLVRRVGRRRLLLLESAAVTSAARWRRQGWWWRSARNIFCLGLHFLGLPPRWIARVYR
jgi:rSAM/selenodomain-associated transferase 2